MVKIESEVDLENMGLKDGERIEIVFKDGIPEMSYFAGHGYNITHPGDPMINTRRQRGEGTIQETYLLDAIVEINRLRVVDDNSRD